jgi:hypothetical protein
MRKALLLMVLVTSSACGTSSQWQKPGIDQAATDSDLRQCRRAAQQESLRLYADWLPFAFDAPIFWNGRDLPTARLVQEITDSSQMHAERTLAVACMRSKGYAIANA